MWPFFIPLHAPQASLRRRASRERLHDMGAACTSRRESSRVARAKPPSARAVVRPIPSTIALPCPASCASQSRMDCPICLGGRCRCRLRERLCCDHSLLASECGPFWILRNSGMGFSPAEKTIPSWPMPPSRKGQSNAAHAACATHARAPAPTTIAGCGCWAGDARGIARQQTVLTMRHNGNAYGVTPLGAGRPLSPC